MTTQLARKEISAEALCQAPIVPAKQLTRIRELGQWGIYADSQNQRFLVMNDNTNVHFIFTDMMVALKQVMQLHNDAIDRQNHLYA